MAKVWNEKDNYFIILNEIFTDNPNVEYIQNILESIDKAQLNKIFYDTIWPLLHWTADVGHVDVAKILLDYNYDINYEGVNGRTAIIDAIIKGNYNMVKFLIEQGINLQTRYWNQTPLEFSRMYNNAEITALLENNS